MVRDWDVIRKILLKLESLDDIRSNVDSRQFATENNISASMAYHHINMLRERGLVNATDTSSMDGHVMMANTMTWEGHELLDKMREPKLWNDIKSEATKRGIGLSFEAVGALFTKLLATAVTNIQ